MKLILIALLLVSCQPADRHSTAEEKMELALKNRDTVLAKKLAQEELNRLRSTVTDSGFAIMLDAGLKIQELEFAFQKAGDTKNMADELIVNHPNGQRLYTLMMKSYQLAIQNTARSSDIAYYSKETAFDNQEWLENNFAGKSNKEAKNSLRKLQKDIAIISAIVNHMDSDEVRKQTEDSYKHLIE